MPRFFYKNIYYRDINNEHPLFYIRTNFTLSQCNDFITTYNIKEGDGMYLSPKESVVVW